MRDKKQGGKNLICQGQAGFDGFQIPEDQTSPRSEREYGNKDQRQNKPPAGRLGY